MDQAVIELLKKLGEYGPGFLIAGLFFVMYFLERRKNDQLSTKLHELGLASLKADLEHTTAYKSIEKTLDILAKAIIKHE